MKKKIKIKNGFTTVELIISISIMFILGGVFLLNYNLQKDKVDLNNALSIASQEVKKAQSLVMAQAALPSECSTTDGNGRDVFGIYFVKEKNYVFLYVDKNNNGVPDNISLGCDPKVDSACCDCQNDECVEAKYFSPSTKISAITPGYDTNTGWIGFSREDLSVKINDGDSILQVDFCSKADCSANTKSIFMNNKGMVDVQ